MSALVTIDSIPIELRHRMIADLEVHPGSATGKDKYKPKPSFPTYDIMGESDSLVAIPFAYFVHHMRMGFPNDKHYANKLQTKFVGTLLDRQRKLVPASLAILNDPRSLLISTPTGYGKTISAVYLSCKIGYQTVIVCHRVQIIKQWEATIRKVCSDPIIQVVDSKNKIDPSADFYIINVINCAKRDRFDFFQTKTVIVDEAHTICTDKFSRSLNYLFPKFLMLLTATPTRKDGQDVILEMFGGPNMIYRPLADIFNVYLLNTGFMPKVKKTARNEMDWHSVLESQMLDPKRNKLIVDLCRYFVTRNILVVCKRKEHVNMLYQELKDFGEDVDVFMGSNKKVNYDCRILIVTYSKGGVGFDNPKMDTLLLASDAEDSYVQYLGRVFRKEFNWPCVIDLIDNFGPLKKHAQTRIQVCEMSGGQIKSFNNWYPDFSTVRTFL